MDLIDRVKAANFPYWKDIICLYVGGSSLHGAKIEGYDDLDIFGVYVEPPEKALGLDSYEHFVWSTSRSDVKNTKDDVDIALYSLRKWAQLACKGNPSILHSLFVPGDGGSQGILWNRIRLSRDTFLSRAHARHFLGFANAQLEKMKGERSPGVSRPDLVAKYGYDTKFAMHTLRLLIECQEFISTGKITLPSPRKDFLKAVRNGEFQIEAILQEAELRFRTCHEITPSSSLQETVDREQVSRIVAQTYQLHWASPQGEP